MKLLFVFALFFCFAVFGSAAGHQCYKCGDMSSKCSSLKNVTCDEKWYSQKYCETTTVAVQGVTTIFKSCVLNNNEARCMPGIAVSNNHPEMKDVKGTILCCEGNLCNSSNKLYNGNVLFIAVLLGCIYGISE